MNNRRPQDLTEAFASIIAMMLKSIRARGWRSLLDLPELWRAVMYVRQQGKALADLMAAFRAGTLPPLAPALAPAPWTDAPEQEAACAQPPAPPRLAARPDSAARARQQPAERPSLPPAAAGPDRPRAADDVYFAAARPRARARAAVRPPRRTPHPIAVLALPAGILATGRCS
jgi:hypothetical protein